MFSVCYPGQRRERIPLKYLDEEVDKIPLIYFGNVVDVTLCVQGIQAFQPYCLSLVFLIAMMIMLERIITKSKIKMKKSGN